MKKKDLYKLLYIVSILLFVSYILNIAVDFARYDSYNNAVPFYLFILLRTIEFFIPSILVLVIARKVNKSNK